MSHYPDYDDAPKTRYDDQLDSMRAEIDRTNQYAALITKNKELVEMSGLMESLTQNTMAQTAQAKVLAGVTIACNRAWSELDAARSEPLRIEASPIKQLRPARQSVEAVAAHFEPQKRYAGGRS